MVENPDLVAALALFQTAQAAQVAAWEKLAAVQDELAAACKRLDSARQALLTADTAATTPWVAAWRELQASRTERDEAEQRLTVARKADVKLYLTETAHPAKDAVAAAERREEKARKALIEADDELAFLLQQGIQATDIFALCNVGYTAVNPQILSLKPEEAEAARRALAPDANDDAMTAELKQLLLGSNPHTVWLLQHAAFRDQKRAAINYGHAFRRAFPLEGDVFDMVE